MPARLAFLSVLLPVTLHRSDLARNTPEESVHPYPPSLSKVDFAPPRVRVRVGCSGHFPFTLSLEGKRALCSFALNLLESALAKNAPVTPLGSALTKNGGGGEGSLTRPPRVFAPTEECLLLKLDLGNFDAKCCQPPAMTKKRAAPWGAALFRPDNQDGG